MNNPPVAGDCCGFCGLPVSGFSILDFGLSNRSAQSVRDRSAAGAGSASHAKLAEPVYCCFGCRFAAAVAAERGPQGELSWTLARLGLATFLTMNVMMFTMALWTNDVYPLDPAGAALSSPLESFFRYLCLVLSLPVAWMLGLPLAENAWQSLRRGRPGTDLLLVLGVMAAFVFSAVSVFQGQGHVYFEVGCVVLVSVTLGRWLEATGRHKTTQALDALERLLPETVRLVRDGRDRSIPLMQVEPGDMLRVLPGERLPVDGRIDAGAAAIDEQLLTGESQPVVKSVGETVHGGTLNLDGHLLLQVTAGPREGALQRLIDAVHRARQAQGHYERLADRAARWFLPGVATIAGVTFAVHAAYFGLESGLLAGLAVVLIACPCALGLATPMAAWAALGIASGKQVLFRDVGAIERLADCRAVAFDKTGTLTTGSPQVSQLLLPSRNALAAEVIGRAAALASGSTHTLAAAIREWSAANAHEERGSEYSAAARGCSFQSLAVHQSRTLPGWGVEGRFDDLPGVVVLGSLRLMRERQQLFDSDLQADLNRQLQSGRSLSAIGWGGKVRGVFLFAEQLRPQAREALADCQALGLTTLVLTGDHAARGVALGRELQLPVQAGLLPDEKVAALHQARQNYGPIVMVGDGINDAPALAAADVGMALGCGADVSRQSAEVCLLGNDLRRVAWSVGLARRTVKTMQQNLFWALVYNTAGIGLAVTGWLNPIWASLAMVASSAIVVGNSLRLTQDSESQPQKTTGQEHPGHVIDQQPIPASAHLLPGSTPTAVPPSMDLLVCSREEAAG